MLPRLPIHVDSPLAEEISMIYEEYPDSVPGDSDDDGRVEFLQSQDEARRCSTQQDPCIIVASGGMCEGGRIVHHLRHHIDDPRSAIVLVSGGYSRTIAPSGFHNRNFFPAPVAR